MIKGVRYGFRYKLKAVYAHFPINMTFESDKAVQVRNFLGEKVVRNVAMLDGVTVKASEEKDEIYVEVRTFGLQGFAWGLGGLVGMGLEKKRKERGRCHWKQCHRVTIPYVCCVCGSICKMKKRKQTLPLEVFPD